MAGTRGNGLHVARVALIAIAIGLAASIATTFLIGSTKLSSAEATVDDASRVLVQQNLSSIVLGSDLVAPVSTARARALNAVLDESILRGEIDAVTIWNPDGTIVFSTDGDLIGSRVPEERDRLKEILKDGASSRVLDGMFSTQVPLAPPGTTVDGVAQLDRVYAPIWNTAARPWRTASFALGVALLLVLGAISMVSRIATKRWKVYAGTTFRSLRGPRPVAALDGGNGADPEYTQPAFREAEESLHRAEVRATTAEERAAALQEQYRKTLEELHAAQKQLQGAASETPSRPDPEIEERLLKAEGRVRLLEGQLQAVKDERDRLASDQAHPTETASDPETARRAEVAEAEAQSLRAELENARREIAPMMKELESARREREQLAARGAAAEELEAQVETARAEAERAKATQAATAADLDEARTRLDETKLQLSRARAELESAGTAAADTAEEVRAAAQIQVREAEVAAATRVREVELAAKADVEAAMARIEAAEHDAATARTALEAAQTGGSEAAEAMQGELAIVRADLGAMKTEADDARADADAARMDADGARAEAEALRATAGTEHAELEDAFRSELDARERELRAAMETREGELRAAMETKEQELTAEIAELRVLSEVVEDLERSLAVREEAFAGREQQLRGDLEARDHDLAALRTREAELLAELSVHDAELQDALTAKEAELRETFEAAELGIREQVAEERASLLAELEQRGNEERAILGDARAELETRETALRAENARLEADLAASRAEIEDLRGTTEAVDAELRGSKGELETVWRELEGAQDELRGVMDTLTASRAEAEGYRTQLETIRVEVAALRDGTADANDELRAARDQRDTAAAELEDARAQLMETRDELTATRTELAGARGEIQVELTRSVEVGDRAEAAERELQEASMRAAAAEHEVERLRHETEITAHELGALREIADAQSVLAEERQTLEEMLRVTQERLASSTERFVEFEQQAEDREREMATAREQIEELESRIRTHEMSLAVKAIRGEDADGSTVAADPITVGDAGPLEDRRASTPFMQELSLDAKKTLTSILGLSLTLKHKKQPNEQAPLLRQLAAYARRLDHTVADLLEADKLARGEVDLHPRRTDLEALVQRVLEESQVSNDHDVRIQTDPIVASVDPVRTEQILMGLLRGSTDRTPLGSAITVRLAKAEGGALISVEDMETSSDASLSPVVERFAEVQGGWARVESRPNGGSAFRVFLPAEGVMPDPAPNEDGADDIEIAVTIRPSDVRAEEEAAKQAALDAAAEDDDPWAAGQLLVQELQKLSSDD